MDGFELLRAMRPLRPDLLPGMSAGDDSDRSFVLKRSGHINVRGIAAAVGIFGPVASPRAARPKLPAPYLRHRDHSWRPRLLSSAK